MHDDERVEAVLTSLSFSRTLDETGDSFPMQAAWAKSVLSQNGRDEVMEKTRTEVKAAFNIARVGMCFFLLIDITESAVWSGAWHDGYY